MRSIKELLRELMDSILQPAEGYVADDDSDDASSAAARRERQRLQDELDDKRRAALAGDAERSAMTPAGYAGVPAAHNSWGQTADYSVPVVEHDSGCSGWDYDCGSSSVYDASGWSGGSSFDD